MRCRSSGPSRARSPEQEERHTPAPGVRLRPACHSAVPLERAPPARYSRIDYHETAVAPGRLHNAPPPAAIATGGPPGEPVARSAPGWPAIPPGAPGLKEPQGTGGTQRHRRHRLGPDQQGASTLLLAGPGCTRAAACAVAVMCAGTVIRLAALTAQDEGLATGRALPGRPSRRRSFPWLVQLSSRGTADCGGTVPELTYPGCAL